MIRPWPTNVATARYLGDNCPNFVTDRFDAGSSRPEPPCAGLTPPGACIHRAKRRQPVKMTSRDSRLYEVMDLLFEARNDKQWKMCRCTDTHLLAR